MFYHVHSQDDNSKNLLPQIRQSLLKQKGFIPIMKEAVMVALRFLTHHAVGVFHLRTFSALVNSEGT